MHNNCKKKVIPILNSVSHWYQTNCYQCYYFSFSVPTSCSRSLKTKEVSTNENSCADDNGALDSFTDRLVQEKIMKWESLNSNIQMPSISRQKFNQPEKNRSKQQLTSQKIQNTNCACDIVKQFLPEGHKGKTDLKKPNLTNGRHSESMSISTIKNDNYIFSSVEYEKLANLNLAQMIWSNGHFENALNVFWNTYEEHINIREGIKRQLQVNFADAICKNGEAVLVLLINFSKKFVKKYNDYILMSYVWEPCFLSKWHSDNQIASDLLQKYPELKDIVRLRVHHITNVSLVSHNIDVVQRLFEVLLKYDMKTQYELVLRSLFDYACSARDFYACSAIVQSCKDLDVTLTDIQNAKFLNLFCQDDAYRDAALSIKTQPSKPSKFIFKF